MIYRFMFTAYCADAPALQDLHHPAVTHLCVTSYEHLIFMYVESTESDIDPEAVLAVNATPYPDGKRFFRLSEVFHYSKPLSEEHWKRSISGKRPWVRVNYLRPEMTSSYFFYHYQFQEENPGVFDKYGILFLYGNLLVLYHETPIEPETVKYEGALSTHNTPVGKENWDDMIEAHFIPWGDPAIDEHPDGPWLPIDTLIFR